MNALAAKLSCRGFVSCGRSRYQWLYPGVRHGSLVGWIGIGFVRDSKSEHRVSVGVGVSDENLIRLASELVGHRFNRCVSVASDLLENIRGQSVAFPAEHFVQHASDSDREVDRKASKMVDDIVTFGVPFMRSFGTPLDVAMYLDRTEFVQREWRLPVALLYAGRPGEGLELVEREMAKLATMSDDNPWKVLYSGFHQRFRDRAAVMSEQQSSGREG